MVTFIPLQVWHALRSVDVVIPYWHMVSDDRELPHVSGLGRCFRNIRQFREDVEFFLQNYSPVTEQDIICHLHGGKTLPPRAVLFTFDDGFREDYEIVAPLLRGYGAPAAFFVTTVSIDNRELCYTQKKSLLITAIGRNQTSATLREIARLLSRAGEPVEGDIVSRILAVPYRQREILDDIAQVLHCDFRGYLDSQRPYLSSQQIRDLLSEGFAIGAHSIDHPLYSELSLSEQLTQTRESMRWLSDRFQINCQSFAFPYHANGVSLEFFRTVFADGMVKVCFGTSGLSPHPFPYNLPRFTPELSESTARETLSRAFCRSLIH
jgi:peptidoglycan/xylan/chitin deacetylase (PgdA/CDA1 family)